MYLREFESQIPYPFDDAMQRRLIVDPTSKTRFVGTGSSHLETFECSHHADAEPPADDQLVFRPLRGRGLSPTDGRTVLGHTRDGPTVAGTRTTMAEPTQRVPETMMETSWSVAVMVRSHRSAEHHPDGVKRSSRVHAIVSICLTGGDRHGRSVRSSI